MKITSILIFFVLLFSLSMTLFSQQSKISDEERRARIVEAYNRQMQMNDFSFKGGEDPLPDAISERFFTGQAAGDWFGHSVSSAGDVNGDGYDDILIGAFQSQFGGPGIGKAYIFFGGIPVDYSPDIIFTGQSSGDNFGSTVSSAGDINGDGYNDIIIGAYGNDGNGSTPNIGRAYVYFGGENMDNIADLVLTGEIANDGFGNSVSSAGDVNGDGYSDMLIGAPFNDVTGNASGAAYIFYGGSLPDNIFDVKLPGEAVFDSFGISVSGAGDVNGDGYSDVIVGAWLNNTSGSDAGSAYIYFGGSIFNTVPDVTLNGENSLDFFGISVSNAGDLNGDGYSDVLVGAYGNETAGNNAGRAYVYFGGSSMDNIVDLVFTGESEEDLFGISVATAGDVNGDGYSDVIVGAENYNGVIEGGRAYVFYGGELMDQIADIIFTGESGGAQRFGRGVANAGDINSDGYSDILVGAPLNSAGGTNAGRAYLYLNSLTGPDIPDEFFTGENSGDELGYSVSNAGDFNGDGYDDIVVGAPYYDDGAVAANGIAYIYFGGPGFDNVPDITLIGDIGPTSSNLFGISVSAAGDINGDGFDDVIVGAPYTDFSGTDAGTAYIFFGSTSTTLSYIFIDGPDGANGQFGISVSDAGDVNGDGYSDVIVGARGYSTNTGRAYIYFGGAIINTVVDVIMTGETTNNNFGSSVSTTGDVNGDGYSDVVVGAQGYSSFTGRAYIYYGGSSVDNFPDVIMTGETTGNNFGRSVSEAGDVNGDGYSDVIVGAWLNDAGGLDAGKGYIYFGGLSMNNTADVIMTGEATLNYFGYSVSSAGDVNGDGFSDIIVGVFGYNYQTGRAYIYFGGSSVDNTADIVMTGEFANDNFGISVSAAGDVNGDGYSDIIVGAYGNDAGGTDAGRAYLYLSSSPPIKPRITTVKDVPFDQGGQVFVNFVRSGYDAIGESNIITEYLVEMSNPPGVNGFSWWQPGTIQPVQNQLYTFVANTPNDSMTNNSGTYYFRITARTSDPNQYWRSNIMYGHSVDNLAPLPPVAFYAQLNESEVNLGWQANLEPDFRDYYVYRSDTPIADDFTLLTTTTDTTFVDNSPLPGNAYYYIQAYDIHDNGSLYSSDSIMAFLSANIKVLLEGSYDAGGIMRTSLNLGGYIPITQPFNTSPWNYTGTESVTTVPANVTDWILVELRSTTTTVVDRRAAFIKNDGSLVDLDGVSSMKFPTATAGDYYVVITHRNHLSVMTSAPVTISFSPALYDMRTDQSRAYGTNAMKDLGGGVYGLYTADSDGSGTVNAADRSNTWNQRNLSGYYGTDVDLSGTVNAADRSSVWNNRNLSTQVPTTVDGPVIEIVKENNK